jgi:anti-sigma B factor antagonist
MLLKEIEHPAATIFHIKGRLDSSSTTELEQRVTICLDQGSKNLVLDFSELDYINSAGLRILVMGYQRLLPLGGQVMVCGARDYIAEIFDISGYNRIFLMYPDLDQAIKTFTATPTGQ